MDKKLAKYLRNIYTTIKLVSPPVMNEYLSEEVNNIFQYEVVIVGKLLR